MRLLVVFLAALLLTAPALPVLRAEEPPQARADDTPSGPRQPWFVKVLSPSEAWTCLTTDLRTVPAAARRTEQAQRVEAYIEAWDAAGADVGALEPDEVQALLRFYTMASRHEAAHRAIESLLAREGLEPAGRDAAMLSLARLLANAGAREALGEERVADVRARVQAYATERSGEDASSLRGELHQALALYADATDDTEGMIRHHMLSAMADPSKAAAAGRSVLRALQGSTHSLEGYGTLRQSTAAIVPVLQDLAARHLATLRATSDDERQIQNAERSLAMLESAAKPLTMLGRPAEGWTLEQAYGDVTSLEDVKGKVVLLDFWATWCPWCIKSFPAIRDLLRDYADKGLAVVGVTASATAVYEQRYDLDDDMEAKRGEERPKPVAQKSRDGTTKEGPVPVLLEDDYQEVERQALERFIANHEMSWPVVMIDQAEPSAKYALTGWPHAVVLDRQGRIRYFKVGALLRDRPEQVAAFRKVLDDLLAEKTETASE